MSLTSKLSSAFPTSESDASTTSYPEGPEVRARLERPWRFRVRVWLAAHLASYGNRLREHIYKHMHTRFVQSGLSLPDVASNTRKCTVHHEQDGDEEVDVVMGKRFRGRMRRAVRLIMLEVPRDASLLLLNAAKDIVKSFVISRSRQRRHQIETASISNAASVLMDGAELCHISIFMTGSESDPRPLSRLGIERELATLKDAVRQFHGPITLRLARIVITETGAVLALWQPMPPSNIDHLRRLISQSFPHAPKGQTEILVHSTLARLLVKRHQLPPKLRRKMALISNQVSAELNGLEVSISSLSHVVLSRRLSAAGVHSVVPLPDARSSKRASHLELLRWIVSLNKSSSITMKLFALGVTIFVALRFSWRRS